MKRKKLLGIYLVLNCGVSFTRLVSGTGVPRPISEELPIQAPGSSPADIRPDIDSPRRNPSNVVLFAQFGQFVLRIDNDSECINAGWNHESDKPPIAERDSGPGRHAGLDSEPWAE